jgi:hypothetical protein
MSLQQKIKSAFGIVISKTNITYIFENLNKNNDLKEKSKTLLWFLKFYNNQIQLKDCLNFTSELLYNKKYSALANKDLSKNNKNPIELGAIEKFIIGLKREIILEISPEVKTKEINEYIEMLREYGRFDETTIEYAREENQIIFRETTDEDEDETESYCSQKEFDRKIINIFHAISCILTCCYESEKKIVILKSSIKLVDSSGNTFYKHEDKGLRQNLIRDQLFFGLSMGRSFHLQIDDSFSKQTHEIWVRNSIGNEHSFIEFCLPDLRSIGNTNTTKFISEVLSFLIKYMSTKHLYERVTLINEGCSGEFQSIFRTFERSVDLIPAYKNSQDIIYTYGGLPKILNEIRVEKGGFNFFISEGAPVYRYILGCEDLLTKNKFNFLNYKHR